MKLNRIDLSFFKDGSLKKCLRIMKLTSFFILVLTLQMSASVYSQTTTMSVKLKNSTLQELFLHIEKSSNYRFFYNNDEVDVNQRISVDAEEKTVGKILEAAFAGLPYSFIELDNKLILIERNGAKPSQIGTAMQQQKSVSGKVTDSSGSSLPGVSIVVKGTTTGTITDGNGNYSLSNVPENAVIQFSFVGMKSQEVAVAEKTTINIKLEEETIGIEEVVAIGYGTMKKSDLTGSVSSIKSEDIVDMPAARNAIEAIQGKVSGVAIINQGGAPGSFPRMRIRGGTSINASSDPLIVVDGFPNAPLPSPEDIKAMEVLKDASATAIYGSQGANGVIIVTTKKGSSDKVKINFSGTQTIDVMSNGVEVLNASEFATFINEVYGRDFFPNSNSYGVGTNWFDLITRQGSKSDYNLTISGGNKKLNYYTSGRYFGQNGIIERTGFKNYSMRGRLDIYPMENLHLTTSMQMGRETRDNQIPFGGVSYALKFNPIQGIYNENGTYSIQSIGDPLINPFAVVHETNNNATTDITVINNALEYDILPKLKFKSTLGVNIQNYRYGGYVPTTLNTNGIAGVSNSGISNLLNEDYLTYSFNVKDEHEFTMMAGYSYQKNHFEYIRTGARNYLTDSGLWWNLGSGSIYDQPDSSLKEWIMESWYGRLNYTFAGKYFLTLTGRYDGSSRFGANNKWAFFPSGALAWNLKNESFMKNLKFLDQFKIRASYGQTGNTSIPEYSSLAKFSNIFTMLDATTVNAVTPTTMANSDLTWEETTQIDGGIDLSFWKGALRINGDYYKKTTNNLLYSVPVVRYSGYISNLENYGSIENKGFELTFGSDFNIKGLKWSTDLNFSLNRNKVLELPGKDVLYSNIPSQLANYDPTQILQVGKPLGSFYGYVFDGLYQSGDDILENGRQPGDIKYRDLNGDKKIDANDRTIIGNPNPKFTIGVTNQMTYKNFDLSFFFNGVFGSDIYNITRMELDGLYGKSNVSKDILNRWTPQNTNTVVPRAAGIPAIKSSGRWIEDGSYIRLKNLLLGYSLPKHLVSAIGADKVRISLSGQNLLTFTKYSGLDPEVSTSFSNLNIGLDYDSYPNVKSYSMGINVTF